MPPLRKRAKKNKRNDGWVAGGMRGIKHEAFIARGGFGEVHKVTSCFTSLTLQMLNKMNGQVLRDPYS
jgi:hypothetical protein